MIYFESQIRRLEESYHAQIKALENEIARLRTEVEGEKRRADFAVDQLLHSAGHVAVTPPKRREETPEEAKLRDALYTNINLAAAIGKDFGESEEN